MVFNIKPVLNLELRSGTTSYKVNIKVLWYALILTLYTLMFRWFVVESWCIRYEVVNVYNILFCLYAKS